MDCLKQLRAKFGEALGPTSVSPKGRVYLPVPAVHLNEIVRFLVDRYRARLATASGRDTRAGVEIAYHLFVAGAGQFLNPLVLAPKPQPTVPSLAGWLPAAVWIEREIHELFGVDFPGHPDLRRLLLADDWPEGVYPLRRNFRGLEP